MIYYSFKSYFNWFGCKRNIYSKTVVYRYHGQIAITVILTKRNPEISSYVKNVFLVNDFTFKHLVTKCRGFY